MQIKVAGAVIPPLDTLVYMTSGHRAFFVPPLHPEPQGYSIHRPWHQPERLWCGLWETSLVVGGVKSFR